MKAPLDKLFHLLFTPPYLSGNTLHSRNKETQHYYNSFSSLGVQENHMGKFFK